MDIRCILYFFEIDLRCFYLNRLKLLILVAIYHKFDNHTYKEDMVKKVFYFVSALCMIRNYFPFRFTNIYFLFLYLFMVLDIIIFMNLVLPIFVSKLPYIIFFFKKDFIILKYNIYFFSNFLLINKTFRYIFDRIIKSTIRFIFC